MSLVTLDSLFIMIFAAFSLSGRVTAVLIEFLPSVHCPFDWIDADPTLSYPFPINMSLNRGTAESRWSDGLTSADLCGLIRLYLCSNINECHSTF